MRLLVLYEELAAYIMACFAEYGEMTDCQILIIAKRPNSVAPFNFAESARVEVLYREKYDEQELNTLVQSFAPEAIFSGGWSYAPYRRICSKYKSQIPVLLAFDNWWTGSMKQRIMSVLSRFTINRWYDRCFVAGQPQRFFAQHLGFKDDFIRTGIYCANTSLFQQVYIARVNSRKSVPRRFLFVGRYETVKGIESLWDAFEQVKKDHPEWELWCAGKGSIAPRESEGIRHLGFVQPEGLAALIAECSTLVLPSSFEPWGVVIHEMATAGLSIITTEQVGAAERFLVNEENGFLIQDEDALAEAMYSVARADEEQLKYWSKASHRVGMDYTLRNWAENLHELLSQPV